MTTPPGKTLCVGASYVSLECAGFLAKLGFDVTVMVRSILLRGFDQQMAEIVGDYMKGHGVNFLRGFVPKKIELIEEGPPRKLRVTYQSVSDGEEKTEEYNTVSEGRLSDFVPACLAENSVLTRLTGIQLCLLSSVDHFEMYTVHRGVVRTPVATGTGMDTGVPVATSKLSNR